MELRNRVNNKRYENFFMVKWCNTIISTEFLLIFQRAVKGDGDGEERDAGIDHRRRRLSLSLFLCLFLLLRRLRLTFLHFLMDSCWSIRKTINNPFATGIMSSNWNIKYLSRPKRGPPTLFWPTFFSLFIITFCFFFLFFLFEFRVSFNNELFYCCFVIQLFMFLRLIPVDAHTQFSTVCIDFCVTHPLACVCLLFPWLCVCLSFQWSGSIVNHRRH